MDKRRRTDDIGALRRELAAAKWRERALRRQLAASEAAVEHAQAEAAALQAARPHAVSCSCCGDTVYVVPEEAQCWTCSLRVLAADDRAA